MNNFRWMFWGACLALLASCSTPHKPAPIEDRGTGALPSSVFEGKPGYYIVKQGDTVMQISRVTGQKPADIIAWNNMSRPNELKVGQAVRVAPPGSEAGSAGVASPSGGVSGRSVEMTPLFPVAGASSTGTAAASPGVINKTVPRGDKQPYSEAKLQEMQQNPDNAAPAGTESAAAFVNTSKSAAPASATGALNAAPNGVTTWRWPAEGKMVSAFSDNKSKGIDIAGVMGQPVVAAAGGKVTHVGPLRGYGNMVIVRHNDNLNSVYAHNRRILVKEGDTVSQGQQIAEMGNSDSDTVKLRFEIRQYGKPIDPTKYLPPR